MEVKERSWTNILIDRPFQLKLMGYFVAVFVVTTFSLYSTTYLFFWNLRNKGLNVGIPEDHIFYEFLLNQKHDLDMLFIGLAVFNFILLLAVGFIISHRIAGPIYKLKQHLKDPKLKNEPLQFRQNDFFKELGPMLNDYKDKK
ncbi:hypothetical protein ACJVC5_08860 [Peredibacter sp. HCB2-198]|uniref:hypothetical protein n=1 Tax=Peredibacter sp. HCB2-198 TaxID=3383025 RepID=UPI0038B49403